MTTKHAFQTIRVDKANFEHMSKSGEINGSLLLDIQEALKAVALEYAEAGYREGLRDGHEAKKLDTLLIYSQAKAHTIVSLHR